MKKALRETRTLRAGCSKPEPKKFRTAADPFQGAQDCQNLISWRRSLPSPIETQFGEDRCTQFRVNRGNRPTNGQDRLQYTAPLSLARSVINKAINKSRNIFFHPFAQKSPFNGLSLNWAYWVVPWT